MDQSTVRVVGAVIAVLSLGAIVLRRLNAESLAKKTREPIPAGADLVEYALWALFVIGAASAVAPIGVANMIARHTGGKIIQPLYSAKAAVNARLMVDVSRPLMIEPASDEREGLGVYVVEKVLVEELSPPGRTPVFLKRAIVKRKDDGTVLSAFFVGDNIAKEGDEVRIYFVTGPTNGTGAQSRFLVAVPK